MNQAFVYKSIAYLYKIPHNSEKISISPDAFTNRCLHIQLWN